MKHDADYMVNSNGKEVLVEVERKNINKEIIKEFVKCRKDQKITQMELARRTGISQPNITRFESGRYNPSLDMMLRIAEALDVQMSIQLNKKTE